MRKMSASCEVDIASCTTNVLLLTTPAFVIAASGEHHPDRVISLAVSVTHQIRLLTDVKHLTVLTVVVSWDVVKVNNTKIQPSEAIAISFLYFKDV